jgi:hypothetical protein
MAYRALLDDLANTARRKNDEDGEVFKYAIENLAYEFELK